MSNKMKNNIVLDLIVCFLVINSAIPLNAQELQQCITCNNCPTVKDIKFCEGIHCYTKLRGDEVNRGCTNYTEGFCESSDLFCETCKSPIFCNNKEIEFPKCVMNDGQNRVCKGFCYYYSKDSITKRGCLADVEDPNDDVRKECEKNTSSYCQTCFFNECNKNAPLSCITCDENDQECTSNVNDELLDKRKFCNYDENRCFVSYDEKTKRNKRGCTTERKCDENSTDNMTCCPDSDCNKQMLPANRLQCLKKSDAAELKVCLNPKDKCYVKFEQGNITRGCMSDDENSCQIENENCKICAGNKCNKQITCKTCNDIVSIKCQSKLCDNNVCISQIQDGKMIHRCAEKNEKCGSEDECQTCKTNDCNANYVPKTWLKCQQCEGNDCLDGLKPEHAKYCPKYNRNDACYIMLNNKTISRGCVSDLPENHNCSANSTTLVNSWRRTEITSEQCFVCYNDTCNSQNVQLKPLQCVQCDSKTPGCGPKWNNTLVAKECPNPMPDKSPERCYTYKKEVKRGCLADVTQDEKCVRGETCHLCDTDGCNVQDSNSAMGRYEQFAKFNYLSAILIAFLACH